MWQAGALAEGRAALVVDEDEAEVVRSVGRREAGDEGLQQLGLAGAGGAADERVGSVAGEVDLVGPGCREPQQGSRCADRSRPGAPRVRRRRGGPGPRLGAALGTRRWSGARRPASPALRHRAAPASVASTVEPARVGQVGSDVVDTPAGRGQRGAVATVLHLDHRRRSRPAARSGRARDRGRPAPVQDPAEQVRDARDGAQLASAVEHDEEVGDGPRPSISSRREPRRRTSRRTVADECDAATRRPRSALLGRACLPRR